MAPLAVIAAGLGSQALGFGGGGGGGGTFGGATGEGMLAGSSGADALGGGAGYYAQDPLMLASTGTNIPGTLGGASPTFMESLLGGTKDALGMGVKATGNAAGTSLFGTAANALGGNSGIGSLLGGAAGLLSSANAPDSETVTQQRTVDPRVDAALWGQNGQGGLFNMLMSELQKGPNAGTRAAWGVANNYFGAR